MKISTLIDYHLTVRIFLVFLIGLMSYFVSPFIIIYSYPGIILLTIFSFSFILFWLYPKLNIYVTFFMFPLLPLMWLFTNMQFGDSKYLSVNLGGVLKVFVLFFGILFLVYKRTNFIKSKVFAPILLFNLLLIVGIVFISQDKLYALRQLTNYALPPVIYLLILECFDDVKEPIKILKLAMIFFVIPNTIIGFYQIATFVKPEYISPKEILTVEKYARFGALAVNANIMSFLLSIFMMFSIYLYFNTYHRRIYAVFFISMLVLQFYTFSRSGWAAFLSAISLFGIMRYRKTYIVFILVIVFLIAFIPPIRDRAFFRFRDKEMLGNRPQTFSMGITLFSEKPFMGYGPGGYETSYIVRRDMIGAYGVAGTDAHNEYITILVEGGIFLIGTYLFMLYRCFMFGFQVFKLKDKPASDFGLFIMSIVPIIFMGGFSGLCYNHIAVYLWAAIAIGQIYLRQGYISNSHIVSFPKKQTSHK